MAGINGVTVSLRPEGYQFLDLGPDGNWHDENWLNIAGAVDSPEGSWQFVAPCLLTTEAVALGEWLAAVADHNVAPSKPDSAGDVWPALDFVEPNIAFGVEVQEAGDVILRVHFSLESAPEWERDEQRVASSQFYVRCWLSDDAVRAAATQWIDELSAFPERGERTF